MESRKKTQRLDQANDSSTEINSKGQEVDPAVKNNPIDQIISNPLITDIILGFLLTPDILYSYSVVSKNCNNLSRDYIRRRRPCCIKYNVTACQDGLLFPGQLLNEELYTNHPFNGLHLSLKNITFPFSFETDLEEWQSRFVTRLTNITEQLEPFKHLVVEFTDNLKRINVHEWIVKSVLEFLPKSEMATLKIVVAHGKCTGLWWAQLFGSVQINAFSNVKVFQLDFEDFWEHTFPQDRHGTDDYELILRSCPNLTNFKAPVPSHCVETFSKYNKMFLIKWLLFLWHPLSIVVRNLELLERAEDVSLEAFAIEQLSFWKSERYESIDRILQQTSLNTLKEVKIRCCKTGYDEIYSLELTPLPNVENVVVTYKDARQEPSPNSNDEAMLVHPHLRQLFPNAVITAHRYN